MAVGKLGYDTHIAIMHQLMILPDPGSTFPGIPDYLFAVPDGMKGASAGKPGYIYRKIRWRHDGGYKLFNRLPGEAGTKAVDMSMPTEQRSKERKANEVISMP